jgi:hypothetical protein
MSAAQGYKAHYDYVDLLVENQGDHWRLTLRDPRHGEDVVHEDKFATAAEAQDAALALAQHHIHVAHNDTLLRQPVLSWGEMSTEPGR